MYARGMSQRDIAQTIEDIYGFEIDHSFLTYKKELKDCGYEVAKISMKDKFVIIKKK